MAAIIIDFDGTIADSFDFIVDFLAQAAGRPVPDATERAELRGRSMAAIGRDFGLSWFKLFRLFFKGRRQMRMAIKNIQPFDGVPAVIQKLHAEGHELFIVSSNTVKNIHRFLHKYQLHTYFLELYGGVSLFGKAPALRRLLKDQNIEKKDAIYIGDELRDIQAAHAAGLRIIAVTWGFARPSRLELENPTALAEKPEDIIKILEEL